MTSKNRSIAIFIVSMAFGTAVPLAASSVPTNLQDSDGQVIRLHRAYTTRDRADYNHAIEIYREYLRRGVTGLVRPQINKRETIDVYLNNPIEADRGEDDVTQPLSTKDYVRPQTDRVGTEQLNNEERRALQRSVKTGKCWNFRNFSAGFHELCERMIQGTQEVRTRGLAPVHQGTRLKSREVK